MADDWKQLADTGRAIRSAGRRPHADRTLEIIGAAIEVIAKLGGQQAKDFEKRLAALEKK